MKKTFKIICIICLFFNFASCGIYKKVDARKVDPNAKKRAEKNIQEGKGFRLLDGARDLNRGGVFEFASSNPLWRASIKLLEFTPLSNVDYSGGIIITDWFYDDDDEDSSVKITVKFLSNEIRADGIDVIVCALGPARVTPQGTKATPLVDTWKAIIPSSCRLK